MITGATVYSECKATGIPSIGDIPVHWEVRRLRHVSTLLVSNVDKKSNDAEAPVRLCNYVDVYRHDRITQRIRFMRATATPEEIARFQLRIGDVIITKDSEGWNDIGVPSLVEYEAADLICAYHLAILRARPGTITGEYLFRAIQSQAVSYQFHVSANGVTRYGLAQGAIKDAVLPIPPLDEQDAIVRSIEHVERLIKRFTGLGVFVGKQAELAAKRGGLAGRGTGLLIEYRNRFISDVVTGKLDVREAATRLPKELEQPQLRDEGAFEDAPEESAYDDAEAVGEGAEV